MYSANKIFLIFTILLHGGIVFSMPHEVPKNVELVGSASNSDSSTTWQWNTELLRLIKLPFDFIFGEYARAVGYLDTMNPDDYKQAMEEYFEGDTESLQDILNFAETLPEDRLTCTMYTELYELMVRMEYDRIEDYIEMWYMMEEKPRLDDNWYVLAQNLTRTVAQRLLNDSSEICYWDGDILTWVDHMIKKEDDQGVLFKKSIEQLYAMDKKIGEDCFGWLLFKWEEIMPEMSDWVYKYVLTFDVLPLRVRGLDKVQDMFLFRYSDTENSLRNQYAYKLTVSMLELMYTDGLDVASFYRLHSITAYHSYNIKRAASADKVCFRSDSTWQYLLVDPMSDGVNWNAEVWTYGDTSTRGHWRLTPVPDAGDGFYLTNVYTGLDFSMLMNNTESGSASSANASRTVYTFYGGDAFVTLAERDTKRTLAVVDEQLKMFTAEDKNYFKWTIEGC